LERFERRAGGRSEEFHSTKIAASAFEIGRVAGMRENDASAASDDPNRTAGIIQRMSRGDKTPLELFLAGIRGWEAYLRRRLDDKKPVLE